MNTFEEKKKPNCESLRSSLVDNKGELRNIPMHEVTHQEVMQVIGKNHSNYVVAHTASNRSGNCYKVLCWF